MKNLVSLRRALALFVLSFAIVLAVGCKRDANEVPEMQSGKPVDARPKVEGFALVSAGRYPSVDEAATSLGTSLRTFAPNPDNRAVYRQAFDVFRNTRDALRPVWPQMRELRRRR